jgi:hypothetical protein
MGATFFRDHEAHDAAQKHAEHLEKITPDRAKARDRADARHATRYPYVSRRLGQNNRRLPPEIRDGVLDEATVSG